MIQRVSIPNKSIMILKQKEQKARLSSAKALNTLKPYADSFVSNAKKTTPAMIALTGMWTAADVSSRKMPVKNALSNNIKSFFLPVVIGSSILLSVIENRKTQKNIQ